MPTYTTDPRILNLAGYLVSVHPMANANGSVTVAWYDDAAGGQRAAAYLDAPAYVHESTPAAIKSARDFLYRFLTTTQRLGVPTHAAAMGAWMVFNRKLDAYQSAVRDFTASGANVGRWVPPFPQTIAGLWRDTVTSYVNAWLAMRNLATSILGVTSGGNVATAATPAAPTQATPMVRTSAPEVTATAFTPEVVAQITGTQRVGVAPTATLSPSAATMPSAAAGNAAQQAQIQMTEAGQPLVIPEVPPNLRMVHTPLYKMPEFWFAVGGGALILGGAYWYFRK